MELNQEIYRILLESLPGGIYLVNRDRRIVLWNNDAEQITGYLRQEVTGRCCRDNLLMHCDENDSLLCGVACPLQETMRDGHPRELDAFLRHKDGQRVPVRVRAVPVRNEHGSIIGAAECFDQRAVCPGASDGDLSRMPDRTAILDFLRRAVENLSAFGLSFGVLSISIDDLDQLRHRDGRNAVKAVLCATAQTLYRNLGPNDILGRWSDARFMVMIANCDEARLLKVGNTLRRIVRMEGVPWWGDRLAVTLTVGGTVARAGDTAESLIGRSERALESGMQEHEDQAVII